MNRSAGPDTFSPACGGRCATGSIAHRFEPLEPRTLLAAVKIMPLGDSITESFSGHASYRFWLDKKLELHGYDIDFVGSRTGVHQSGQPNNQGTPLYTDFDQDHEGHAGWRTDQILAEIDDWAPQFSPDVVLLHLGTNDMLQSHTVQETIGRLDDIIDTIRVARPDVKIALAKLIPSRVLNNNIQALNAQIPALAAAKDTPQSPVVLVDQYTGYDAFVDNYDEYHPNQRGEIKMMNKWFDALDDLLGPPPNPPPPVTYVSDLPWVSMTNGFGPAERDRSNGESGPDDGGAIELDGVTTIKGIGTHAASEIVVDLDREYARFRSDIGVDDEVGSAGSVVFQVFVDGVKQFDSGTMTGPSPTQSFDIDVAGAETLRLVVANAGDGDAFDHGDWANARLITAPRVTQSDFTFATKPHELMYTFSRDVSGTIGADDLLLENLTTMQTIATADIAFTYDAATHTARFRFPGLDLLLPDGNYRSTLDAAGIADPQGNPMLADHVHEFFFLRGDANHDGNIDLDDFDILVSNFGQSPRDFTEGDFNYDETVNLADFNILASRFGTILGPPTVAVGFGSTSHRASGGVWSQVREVAEGADAEEDLAVR